MKIRYLFGLAVLFGVIAIIGLRFNNEHAYKLGQQILQQDQAGQPVTTQLQSLRRFVFAHMNTSTSIFLQGAYQRAQAGSQSSNDVYSQAQASCDRMGVLTVNNAKCVQDYLAAHLQPSSTQTLDKSPYTYSFAAPGWSPDVAGLSLLAAMGCALASLVVYVWRLFKNRTEATL